MIGLTPEQVTPTIRNLFPRSGHTWRRPLSVLDGTGGGLILTDDPTAPSWAATADVSDDGTVFMAGALDREIVASIFEAVRNSRFATGVATPCSTAIEPLPKRSPGRSSRTLEMGVITDHTYHRRGLATIVSAQTILDCERLGHETWWNTATTNLGSINLARKLGYRTERPYRVLSWARVRG